MKVVVAVRCYNEAKNIERFLRGYDFADAIVVSDGGSSDDSVSILKRNPKVQLHHFDQLQDINGELFNPDNPHINFVLNKAKECEPDWIIFDDMDDVPNRILREQAREILEHCQNAQVNVFRLYMWGETQYFPQMNNYFDPAFTSLWAWQPKKANIHADEGVWHGTIVGLSKEHHNIEIPMCLLHRSWHPDTIDAKVERYRRVGIQTSHPFNFAGSPAPLPEWAHE